MDPSLSVIEPQAAQLDVRIQEDQMIDEALRILDQRLLQRGQTLTSPEEVRAYLKLKLAPHEHEVFAVVFLDAKHRLLTFEELFYGSIDGASVYPSKWSNEHCS